MNWRQLWEEDLFGRCRSGLSPCWSFNKFTVLSPQFYHRPQSRSLTANLRLHQLSESVSWWVFTRLQGLKGILLACLQTTGIDYSCDTHSGPVPQVGLLLEEAEFELTPNLQACCWAVLIEVHPGWSPAIWVLYGPHPKEERDWNRSRILALTLVCSIDGILPTFSFSRKEL